MRIKPKQPFDFSLTASLFSNGDPAIEIFENGEYRKVLRLKWMLFLLKVKQEGDALVINSDEEEVIKRVKYIFDTERAIQEFYTNHVVRTLPCFSSE